MWIDKDELRKRLTAMSGEDAIKAIDSAKAGGAAVLHAFGQDGYRRIAGDIWEQMPDFIEVKQEIAIDFVWYELWRDGFNAMIELQDMGWEDLLHEDDDEAVIV